MEEEVLVFPSRVLASLGTFVGFSADLDRYLGEVFNSEHLTYLPRSRAEVDPNYKQLVAYAVLRVGDTLCCYQRGRAGGEARLHDLWSIGVGGHICREDGARGIDAYIAGFERELAEEVAIESPYSGRMVGMVHDDRTPVGAVHFGIVHCLDLADDRVAFWDKGLRQPRFLPLDEVIEMRDRLESWSAFVLDGLFSTCHEPDRRSR